MNQLELGWFDTASLNVLMRFKWGVCIEHKRDVWTMW